MLNNSTNKIIRKEIKDHIFLNIIEITELDNILKTFIDENIVSIYKGKRNIPLLLTKKLILDFLEKKDMNAKMGSISEFFIHLYLRSKSYKQECLWSNLEENSMKKGFDGYYSFENKEWIVESKSGNSKTLGISHHDKIDKAYEGLKESIHGLTSNNPWENAYYHASLPNVNAKANIIKKIENLSIRYMLNDFADISEFNIIPCSTIFFNGTITDSVNEKKLLSKIETFNYKELEIICISKKSLEIFFEYLEK